MNAAAVNRRLHGALQIQVIVQIAVLSSVDPVQDAVVILLKPIASLVVRARKANRIRRERTVGINPLVLLLEPDALDIGIIAFRLLEAADLIIGQPFQRNIPRCLLVGSHIFPDRRHVEVEILSERLKRRLKIRGLSVQLRIHDLRIYDKIVHLLTCRKLCSLRVNDVPPPVGQGDGIILLLGEHLLLVTGSVLPCQPDQSDA